MKPFPSTPKELSKVMRELRGFRSLRDLESESDFTKSTLSRYENGQLPPHEYAHSLDELYGGQGWLEFAIVHLRHKKWNPWGEETPEKTHAFKWPAPHEGDVWIHVKPNQHAVQKRHSLSLTWGPWEYSCSIALPKKGVCFITGKAPDDEAVTCMLTANYPIYVYHGAGTVEIPTIDIRSKWQRS